MTNLERNHTAASEPILQVKDLAFQYSKKQESLFKGLSFSIEAGEAVLLMGPSGCGKSSLAYCLAGLYPAYAGELSGQIFLDGKPLEEYSVAGRSQKISILFQNPDNQFCMDRVDHEILFALENINYQGDLNARVDELLKLVGLEDVKSRLIHTLSGGTKQKLALATAMATEAKILLLDEPFANLDPGSRIQIAKQLKALHDRGLTLLIVDHRPDYWSLLNPRILMMEKEGAPVSISFDELYEHREEFSKRGLFLDDSWIEGHNPPPVADENDLMAEAKDLCLYHGKQKFISGLSFSLPKGSITALVGRNGSGKSTLLTSIAGVGKYTGSLTIKDRVGLVFQNPRFQFLTLTVENEILETLKVIHPKESEKELMARVDAYLEEFAMTKYRKVSPYALSQGQQRRLALLSMLAGDRPLLLLDEPTYAQDEKSTQFILDLLDARVAQGLTAVLATHDLALAAGCANQILLLEDGKLTKLSAEAFAAYRKEREEAYISDTYDPEREEADTCVH